MKSPSYILADPDDVFLRKLVLNLSNNPLAYFTIGSVCCYFLGITIITAYKWQWAWPINDFAALDKENVGLVCLIGLTTIMATFLLFHLPIFLLELVKLVERKMMSDEEAFITKQKHAFAMIFFITFLFQVLVLGLFVNTYINVILLIYLGIFLCPITGCVFIAWKNGIKNTPWIVILVSSLQFLCLIVWTSLFCSEETTPDIFSFFFHLLYCFLFL